MAEDDKKEEDKKPDEKKPPVDVSTVSTDNGENTYWVRQGDGVSIDGCLDETVEALWALSKWFFEQTSVRLVLTAGTNGVHADGPHSHAHGYKLDINDWYGPDGLGGEYLGYPLDGNGTELLGRFVEYGHTIGVGMSIEGDHVDVQIDGTEWKTGGFYGGFNSPNGHHGPSSNGKYPKGNHASDKGLLKKYMGDVVNIKKLPVGKLLAEPIYPDFITVSDTVPQWILDQVNAQHESVAKNVRDQEKHYAQVRAAAGAAQAAQPTTKDGSAAQAVAQMDKNGGGTPRDSSLDNTLGQERVSGK